MEAKEFLGLEPTHNPFRFHLPVRPGLSTWHGFLFGGAGLGAAVEALETATGRPVVWAAAQYLSYARTGSVVDLDVKVAVSGHNITQARVTGHVADQEILTVNAALGSRDSVGNGEWAQRPTAPHPDLCPQRTNTPSQEGSINELIDVRLVEARSFADLPLEGPGLPSDSGRSVVWARIPDVREVTAMSLAILGDFVPFGVGQARGIQGGGNSLDNTLRMVQLVPTEWVLLDIRIHAVHNGFAHGLIHLWSEDGTLMATASQSVIVRSATDRAAKAAKRAAQETAS